MTTSPTAHALPWRAGLSYGLLGLPLAFAALPLYVVLPHHYARSFGLPLATVGALLMAVRMVDAVVEPWLGRASDALFARSARAVLLAGAVAATVQGLGMAGLFFPAVDGQGALGAWLVGGLLVTCMAHSLLVIAHQAWGVRLGGDDLLRGRIVAWREGLGLAGVIAASALSVVWGPAAMLAVLGGALLLGWLTWWRAPRPVPQPPTAALPLWEPLAQPAFRRLLAVFMCNGIASAIPAALMLFFAQDRLQASETATAAFLVLYFICGAASMPLWLRAVQRWGLAWSWWLGMLLAVVCFAWTAGLGSGQVQAFAVICALTGVALGADLALPGALLARLIAGLGAQGKHDGAYLGWWNLATKLNLALAAGAALPLLQWLGYAPGSQDAQALQHLAWAYALVPCALKLLAALLLYVLLIRREPHPAWTPRSLS
ncbi:MFS transporter [Comamonas aquatica DA1877]|uniref:MFS transporter n=1 Tax=Comamonas aquatica DA1877 TaxID=1457173 RepID=A0A014MJ56_9BURK|nr:MFS transporter [Comamonas aquatica]EXU81701.1 MFS transporter [Comamonas aquatica DA1877]